MAAIPKEAPVSHAYSLRSAPQAHVSSRRPYRTIVVGLMVVTSSVAVFDLYLFATSGPR